MGLKLRKIIRQIKRQEFGQPAPSTFSVCDPGHRRAAHAPMCIR